MANCSARQLVLICISTASLGELIGLAFVFCGAFAPDVIGPEAYFIPAVMLSLAHAGIPFAVGKWRTAAYGIVVLVVFCTFIQVALSLRNPFNPLIGYLLCAAICGATSYNAISKGDMAVLTGAMTGVAGLSVIVLIAWGSSVFEVRNVCGIPLPLLAALVAFGPVMGMTLAIPAVAVRSWRSLTCDHHR